MSASSACVKPWGRARGRDLGLAFAPCSRRGSASPASVPRGRGSRRAAAASSSLLLLLSLSLSLHRASQLTTIYRHRTQHLDTTNLPQSRRAALGLFGAAAAAVAAAGAPAPALAAYGDAANVFGRVTNKSGFVPYAGEGFAVLLPSKWNPSKEKDFGGSAETVLR